jgi:hypothetical protein
MKITYDIYRFYNTDLSKDEVYADKFKTVTTDNVEIIGAFNIARKLYVGACYNGCKIIAIEE